MLKSLTKSYADSRHHFQRFPKIRWLSVTYTIPPDIHIREGNAHIRLATPEDIEYLSCHPCSDDHIIQSTLQFWKIYGFRSLYLGFFDDEKEPTMFQYVLYEKDNSMLKSMAYGGMYEHQSADSAQLENIYLFRRKKRKNSALHFTNTLFSMLYDQGIRSLRGHIHIDNLAALRGARTYGFLPDKWIVLVLYNFPLLRQMPMRFFHLPIREDDYNSYPLRLFKNKDMLLY